MEVDERIATGLREHFAAFREADEADGGRLGFKIAFNPPAVQAHLGLPYSLVAGLRRRVRHSGGPHSLAGGTRIALEAEVAVELGRDLAADASEADGAGALESVMPAIEVVDLDRPFDALAEILRDGVFQRAVAFGDPTPAPPDGRIAGVVARILHNDRELARLDAEIATGEIPSLLLHVARLIEPHGLALRAGDRLILGSMAPPVEPTPGDRFELTLEGIGSVALDFVA